MERWFSLFSWHYLQTAGKTVSAACSRKRAIVRRLVRVLRINDKISALRQRRGGPSVIPLPSAGEQSACLVQYILCDNASSSIVEDNGLWKPPDAEPHPADAVASSDTGEHCTVKYALYALGADTSFYEVNTVLHWHIPSHVLVSTDC
jgi:hypothetical protein